MEDSGIRTRHLWLRNREDAHTFVLIGVVTARQSLRVMGNFTKRKKNADYWIENFHFEKKFSTEKNSKCFSGKP